MKRHLLTVTFFLLTCANIAVGFGAAADGEWAAAVACAVLAASTSWGTVASRSLSGPAEPAPAKPPRPPRVRMPLGWRYDWLIERYYVHAQPVGPAMVLMLATWLAAAAIIFVTFDLREVG